MGLVRQGQGQVLSFQVLSQSLGLEQHQDLDVGCQKVGVGGVQNQMVLKGQGQVEVKIQKVGVRGVQNKMVMGCQGQSQGLQRKGQDLDLLMVVKGQDHGLERQGQDLGLLGG